MDGSQFTEILDVNITTILHEMRQNKRDISILSRLINVLY